MMKSKKSLLAASTALAISLLADHTVYAQTNAAAAPAKSQNQDELEEIVVTAQRFSSNLETTPVTVSAFSGTMLDQRQISGIADIGKAVPGIIIAPAAGLGNTARLVLRGAGQENGGILYDPAVGVYIDDVYQPRNIDNFFDFFDVADVEVLRGPQGTLYGRNTSGGAVKIDTKQPSFDWTYSGEIGLGSYNGVDVRGYVSGPLVDSKLAGSLSGVIIERDGYVKSPTGYDNNKDTQSGRAKLLFTPTDDIDVTLAESIIRDRTLIPVGSQITNLPGVVDPNAVVGRDLLTTEVTGPQAQKTDTNNTTITAHYKPTDDLTFSSITGYGLLHNKSEDPIIPFNASGYIIGVSWTLQDQFLSQEFNATYKTDNLTLVGGVYYFYEGGRQQAGAPYSTPYFLDRVTNAGAVYGQGTYKLPYDVSLTAGLRYTEEGSDFTQYYPEQYSLTQGDSKTFYAATPKFGIDWTPTSDLFFYSTYTRGFKSGGFNNVTPGTNIGIPGKLAGPTPYGAEKVTNYEIGGKYTTPDRHFRINADIFEADYNGLQLPVFFPGTVNTYTANAAAATVKGIELEPTWQVTDALNIFGNFSVLNGHYTSPFACSLYNTAIVNCEGLQLKGVSPFQSDIGASYKIPVQIEGVLTLNGDWQHSRKFQNNVSNSLPIVATPTYNLFNASLAWQTPDTHWTVSLEVTNLTDKHFAMETLEIASPTSTGTVAYVNLPRMFMGRIKADF